MFKRCILWDTDDGEEGKIIARGSQPPLRRNRQINGLGRTERSEASWTWFQENQLRRETIFATFELNNLRHNVLFGSIKLLETTLELRFAIRFDSRGKLRHKLALLVGWDGETRLGVATTNADHDSWKEDIKSSHNFFLTKKSKSQSEWPEECLL